MVLIAVAFLAKSAEEAALLPLRMDNCVFLEICLLRESLIAARLRADERALSSVHAQVVEEVVPLSENHAALFVVALQHHDLALRLRILVLEHAELARARNLLIYFDRAHIVVLAATHTNFDFLRYLLCHLCVTQISMHDLVR